MYPDAQAVSFVLIGKWPASPWTSIFVVVVVIVITEDYL